MKNKYTIIGIIITTIILAGVAIFTAMRLYQTRDVAVAPNVPSSKPKAQEVTNTCNLSFTLTIATSTSTATATATSTSTSSSSPTATATATGTASPTGAPNSCGGTCGSNSNCQSNFMCYQGFCRNASCVTETDCTCAVATTSATVAPTQPSLPVVGTSWPTLLGTGFGVLVIIGSLLLAF